MNADVLDNVTLDERSACEFIAAQACEMIDTFHDISVDDAVIHSAQRALFAQQEIAASAQSDVVDSDDRLVEFVSLCAQMAAYALVGNVYTFAVGNVANYIENIIRKDNR